MTCNTSLNERIKDFFINLATADGTHKNGIQSYSDYISKFKDKTGLVVFHTVII